MIVDGELAGCRNYSSSEAAIDSEGVVEDAVDEYCRWWDVVGMDVGDFCELQLLDYVVECNGADESWSGESC